MTLNPRWTRRQFTQALALSAAGSTIMQRGSAQTTAGHAGFAFAGSLSADGSAGAIHVFRMGGTGWRRVQTVAATAPGHLLLHPVLPVLYVLHDVAEWQHLPRAAVSAYTFDRHSGRLCLQGTQPLSLAATHPTHATFVADTSQLLVAAEGGGIYNLLPVAADGSLLPVTGIRKEFGLEDGEVVKKAAPRAVALHPDSSIIAMDAGQESLTRFQVAEDGLVVTHRVRLASAPSQLALAPGGGHAYTLHPSDGSVGVHAVGAGTGTTGLQTFAVGSGIGSIAVAPGGGFLLAAGSRFASLLRIDPASGLLTPHSRLRSLGRQASFAPDGEHVFGFDAAVGSIRQAFFDATTGTAGPVAIVAHVDGCSSLAVCMAGASA